MKDFLRVIVTEKGDSVKQKLRFEFFITVRMESQVWEASMVSLMKNSELIRCNVNLSEIIRSYQSVNPIINQKSGPRVS